MQQKAKADIKIGTGIMEAFTRMPVETEQLLREFIDNSTTSYYDHMEELNKVVDQQKCVINIEWDDSLIIIEDNAFGMGLEEFLRALKPNAKAEVYSEDSRGKYGLGLKYAALNLGSNYVIETTAFGQDKLYYAEMDLDVLKTDVETVDYTISDVLPSKHYTRITITKLERTLKELPKKGSKKSGKTKEQKIRDAISQIYQHDITQGRLDIFLNGSKIVYEEPELLQRKDGGEFFSTFDDSFDFGGKEYTYHGWVAILQKGDVSNAGFMLVQKDRAIQLNYRPEELFGKSNDFRYQRVIGEISLNSDSWVVTFTKNAVRWDDFGLEDTFIQSLLDNSEILSIFKYAKDYRKNKENVTTETVKKWEKDIKKSFSGLGTEPTDKKDKQLEAPKLEEKPKAPEQSSSDLEQTGQKSSEQESPVSTVKKNDNVSIPISYSGVDYEFEIIPAVDVTPETPWIRTMAKDAQKNRYRLEINVRSPFFDEYTDQKSKKLITKMAMCVALAQLSSKKNGLSVSDSQKFVEELNAILSGVGKEE